MPQEKAKNILKDMKILNSQQLLVGPSFLKNSQVKKRVINSNPDFLISRSGIIDFKQFNFKKNKFFLL